LRTYLAGHRFARRHVEIAAKNDGEPDGSWHGASMNRDCASDRLLHV
jgi:hypothetical protein